jgi:sterol desaturase/sphingolipid hydroxylase (fatty acid hydroxylase superfamily)
VLGAWRAADLIVVVVAAALVGVVEWAVHRHLFHAPSDSARAQYLGAGRAHRRHHLDPPDLRWVVLRPAAAAAMLGGVAGMVASLSVPVATLSGAAIAGPWLSAVLVAWFAFGHYEWIHLLIHSGYRPRSRHYRRLARNHRLHHYRNEANWLGVTTEIGDRLLGTRPTSATAVPISETARSLA